MSDLATRLEQAIFDHADLNWSKAATLLDLSPQAATKWKKGQISRSTLQRLADLTRVNYSWLATGEGEMTSKPSIGELQDKIDAIMDKEQGQLVKKDVLSAANPVPVISWVAAGAWSETNTVTVDDAFDWLPRPYNLSKDGFALQVRGESMLPEFRPNDYIFVEPAFPVWDLKNGDLVVVQESDKNEATFKQLVLGETTEDMYLKPLNPDWHEQKMLPKSEWVLVGKVVGKWVKY
ncbi:hypothetical protein B0181_11855 [Moraxella caviae]|uniref:Uncharacterized HTH-type transcriptional regulator CBU_1416 n=1 Tax=Moraxella caviae TaxID=34060 RepID=A0A1S9ZRA0_9GAMM|nr:S24 family peptidase [Moraxella caviae]OOR85880.1 hypothetical protein B0181_11855 [Moraxella caviae]STZ14019.1 Uncharacterized HTH-type transcriptional regulator CBU_1416 [Moraxella caviae]VEW12845.1 Uncharacterized HTH-type transcriptional regulator CBU_1416 [Moraxella caviae]